MTETGNDHSRQTRRSRRAFLSAIAAVGLIWWGWPRVAPLFVGSFDFEEMTSPPGFRRLVAGDQSELPNPFIGLGTPDRVDLTADVERARVGMCAALFGGVPGADVVPIAAFSDYNCPYCRVLTEILIDIAARSEGRVRITWHEWPLLGPTSVVAARAALAADLQGAYETFHKRLMRTRFLPTEAFLARTAEDIGADPDRLITDMAGPDVAARLRNTAALARIFGFRGTPALVVGRTVVIGAVSEPTLRALIDQERRDGPPPVCKA
ncbi:DsbA family protein [Roseovarius aestuariivivens]|uniref:DsbA family protein n=1 Tax=Roseovarius aestuariivivens TaxID=1888910 RepID=UPI0010807B88|nr:DsbA family protein [Roseovarius aestuariivivens]